MHTDQPILIFTDLDGTLLDHHSYEFSSNKPLLSTLKAKGIAVVPNTSKTFSELLAFRKAANITHHLLLKMEPLF